MTTVATPIRTWTDAPEPGRSANDWPYPTEHAQFLITGDLAERVKAALGEPPEAAVFLTEDRVSGGYSEYTQETDYFFELQVGSRRVTFDGYSPYAGYGATGVARLSAWLEEVERKSQ
jgi:hypothetical protein